VPSIVDESFKLPYRYRKFDSKVPENPVKSKLLKNIPDVVVRLYVPAVTLKSIRFDIPSAFPELIVVLVVVVPDSVTMSPLPVKVILTEVAPVSEKTEPAPVQMMLPTPPTPKFKPRVNDPDEVNALHCRVYANKENVPCRNIHVLVIVRAAPRVSVLVALKVEAFRDKQVAPAIVEQLGL